MRYLSLFESEESLDKILLDRIFFLWTNQLIGPDDFKIEAWERSWDIKLITEFGEIGFTYDSDEISYDGGWWTGVSYFTRIIGDTKYGCKISGIVVGTGSDAYVVDHDEVLEITKNKI